MIRSPRSLTAMVAAGVLALSACQGEDARAPSTTRPMGVTDSSAELAPDLLTEIDFGVEDARFQPATPRSGRTVQVVARPVPEHAGVQLRYEWELGGRPLQAEGEIIDLPKASPGVWLAVTITPFLNGAAGTPHRHEARVAEPEPELVGISFTPADGLHAGSEVRARALVADAPLGEVRYEYRWFVDGVEQDQEGEVFSTEGLQRGDRLRVSAVAIMGHERTAPFESEEITLVNAPPRVRSEALQQSDTGVVSTRFVAEDPDGDRRLRFELVKAPSGLEFDRSTGTVRWNPNGAEAGRHEVEVRVTDDFGGVTTAGFELNVGEVVPASPADR